MAHVLESRTSILFHAGDDMPITDCFIMGHNVLIFRMR